MRKPKEKLYCCPKCNKPYRTLGWMKRHLAKMNHGFTWLIYYTSDFVKNMEYRLAQLEFKMSNLNLQNIVVKSSDIAIERIKQEMPKEKQENRPQFTISIKQLNIIFGMVNVGEHNVKPSDVLDKNEKSYEILQTIKN